MLIEAGNTLVRLMYGTESKSSLTKSEEFDGRCIKNLPCKYAGALGSLPSGGLGALAGLLGLGKGTTTPKGGKETPPKGPKRVV